MPGSRNPDAAIFDPITEKDAVPGNMYAPKPTLIAIEAAIRLEHNKEFSLIWKFMQTLVEKHYSVVALLIMGAIPTFNKVVTLAVNDAKTFERRLAPDEQDPFFKEHNPTAVVVRACVATMREINKYNKDRGDADRFALRSDIPGWHEWIIKGRKATILIKKLATSFRLLTTAGSQLNACQGNSDLRSQLSIVYSRRVVDFMKGMCLVHLSRSHCLTWIRSSWIPYLV